jgi:hypothetical protein
MRIITQGSFIFPFHDRLTSYSIEITTSSPKIADENIPLRGTGSICRPNSFSRWKSGISAAFSAALPENIRMVEMLLAAVADACAVDDEGIRPLTYARGNLCVPQWDASGTPACHKKAGAPSTTTFVTIIEATVIKLFHNKLHAIKPVTTGFV